MVTNKIDYEKHIQRILKKSFPLLKNHKIIVVQAKLTYGIRAIYLYFFSLYIIGRGAERGLTTGGVAHELSHIEIFKRWGFWKSFWLCFWQYFSGDTRRRVERGADLVAISKGYGRELYKTRSGLPKNNERVKKLLKDYYLSLNEIKKYTKEQKSTSYSNFIQKYIYLKRF